MLATDGPFAETKEPLGGYYLTGTPSLDEAPTWATKIPSAANGSIEVRPPTPHESYCTHMVLASAVRGKIVHAKKIAKAKSPYENHPADAFPKRVGVTHVVTYLVFNEGYSVTKNDALIRCKICTKAI